MFNARFTLKSALQSGRVYLVVSEPKIIKFYFENMQTALILQTEYTISIYCKEKEMIKLAFRPCLLYEYQVAMVGACSILSGRTPLLHFSDIQLLNKIGTVKMLKLGFRTRLKRPTGDISVARSSFYKQYVLWTTYIVSLIPFLPSSFRLILHPTL